MENLEKIKAKGEKWRNECLLKKPFPKAQTEAGIDIKVVYTPEDVEDIDYLKDIDFPGEPPYVRGIFPSMYRGKLWTMRQYAGLGTAEDTNERFKYLLQQGQMGLSIAFDLPTQIGIDSDSPLAKGEVGRVGVAVDTLADMEIIFDGIPLDKISTSMTINPTASILLAMYIATGEKQGVPQKALRAILQNDILKEYLSRGTHIFPPSPSMKLTGDVIEYCAQNLPRTDPISICGYHMSEAGASSIQEVAYCLSDAICYTEEVLKRGIPVDNFASKLSFLIRCGMDLFEEVAKFRAARKLWAKIMKERFHAKNPRSMMFRVFSGCEANRWTMQEPLNNIIRGTICALSGILGGTNSLHITSYDESYAIPSEESSTIALRTQQIIAEETSIPKVADPLGGSYYIEWLTKKMEEEIEKEINKIEQKGGMLYLIESGEIQRNLAARALEHQRKIDSGEITVVGVNKYVSEKKAPPQLKIQKYDLEVPRKQIERLNRVKQERNNAKVKQCLKEIREIATSNNQNIIPFLIRAVKEYATCGEIVNTLKEVYGEYREVVNL